MVINLDLFIAFELFLFAFLPILILSYIPKRKNYTKLNIIYLWNFFYLSVCLCLTLLNVSLTKNYISFHIPTNHSFFEFNFADGLNLHNFIINIALSFPLGIICFYYNKIINGYQFQSKTKKLNICLVGLLFAFSIELLQGILPTGRFFDPSDLLFDSLSASFAYFIVYIYDKIINFKLKKKKHL